jgi:hypothetical protein
VPHQVELSDAAIKAAMEANFGMVAPAARALGVSAQTLRRRLLANPSLALTQQEQADIISDHALGAIIQKVIAGDFRSVRWWLSRFAPERGWGSYRWKLAQVRLERERVRQLENEFSDEQAEALARFIRKRQA